jgi:hypothetical protein
MRTLSSLLCRRALSLMGNLRRRMALSENETAADPTEKIAAIFLSIGTAAFLVGVFFLKY